MSSYSRALLIFALTAIPTASSQSFEPASDTISDCNVFPYSTPDSYYVPSDATCTDAGDPSMIESIAVKYAPVVFFSPLEQYTLADPMTAFEGTGKIMSKDGTTLSETLDLSNLANLTSSNQFIMKDLTDDYKAGAGYDESGASQAPVYFTYVDLGNNVWAINYYYFYAYTGRISMGYAGANGYNQFQVAPFGIHDGDWNTVSVLICATSVAEPTTPPLAVHYFGLAQSQVTDCGAGECTFYEGTTTHAVAFSSLNVHSMSSSPSLTEFYANVDLTDLFGAQLLILDVTQYAGVDGTAYHFMPSADNVKWADPSVDVWQFGGNWGNVDETASITPDLNLICTNTDSTEYVECGDTLEVITILSLFDQFDASQLPDGLVDPRFVQLIFQPAPGDYGPYSWPNSNAWIEPETAPIWTELDPTTLDESVYCEEQGVTAYLAGGDATPPAAPADDPSTPVAEPTTETGTNTATPPASTSGSFLRTTSVAGMLVSLMILFVQ